MQIQTAFQIESIAKHLPATYRAAMKWFLLFLLVSSCFLQAQEQEYIEIYHLIGQADALKESGQNSAATERYRDAKTALEKLKAAYPNWNQTVVQFRLEYLDQNLNSLANGSTNATSGAIDGQTAIANSNPGTNLQSNLVSLQKERDLLKVSLEQEKKALEQKIVGTTTNDLVTTSPEKKSEPVPATQVSPATETVKPETPAEEKPSAAETKSKPKKEIPPGSGALVAQAEKAFAARRFDEAEKKYLEVLHQDENNVYILGNLAATEMEMDHIDDVEKNVHRALAIDPDDAFSLTLLGMVKFRQEKLDEALDVLSRSAKLDPKNPETQNYLGITLSQKGRRTEAESALRKALQLQPGYAGAHYNLALIYASEKPPFLELARWHYNKAIALGHPKNAQIEKMIASEK